MWACAVTLTHASCTRVGMCCHSYSRLLHSCGHVPSLQLKLPALVWACAVTPTEASCTHVGMCRHSDSRLPLAAPSTLPAARRTGTAVYAWGRGDMGQLGLPCAGSGHEARPSRVTGLDALEVVDVSCGDFNTVVVTRDGEVYCFGANDDGQLGSKARAGGGDGGVEGACEAAACWQPSRVIALDLHKVEHVAAGRGHVLALTDKVGKDAGRASRGGLAAAMWEGRTGGGGDRDLDSCLSLHMRVAAVDSALT
eukprot:350888-Chlamydomonas_euryale.AAC.1